MENELFARTPVQHRQTRETTKSRNTFQGPGENQLPFKRVKLGSEPSISQAKAGGLRICPYMAILQGDRELRDL